jgi:ribose transport system substrate-binding protein
MKKFVIGLGGAVVLIGLLTGCGTTNAGGTGSSGAADTSNLPKEVVELAKTAAAPQPWTGPTTSPAMSKDKFIVSIPCGLAAAGCKRIDDGVHAAAEAAGWKVQTIDPANDQNKMNAAIQQAISLGADGIALNSIEPALITSAVADARKAGLMVVNANAGREDEPVTDTSVQHDVSLQGVKQGDMIAATICVNSGGKANVMLLQEPQFNLVNQRVQGTEDYLKKCPDTKSQRQQISIGDLGTTLQSKVKALLASNPDVDTVVSPSDAFTPDVIAAVQQAGLGSKVAIYSMDGNAQVIANIVAGGPAVASVGGALQQEGWAMVDDLNRLFQGEKPVDDGTPIRVISKDNAPKSGEYNGDVDYVAAYKELWTTGKYSK